MRKFYTFVICLTALLCGLTNRAWGDDLLIDGSSTVGNIPITATWTDTEGTKSQSVYLTTDLSEMAGKNITSIRYYANTNLTWSSGGTKKTPTFQISLAEVDATSLSGFLSPSFTTVYTGKPESGTKELFFDFSDSPFYYSGSKNLLVQVYVSVGEGYQSSVSFYAVYRSGASYYHYSSTNSTSPYLPKTTFTYEARGRRMF